MIEGFHFPFFSFSLNVLGTVNQVSCYFPLIVFLSWSKNSEFSHFDGTHGAIVAIIEIKALL